MVYGNESFVPISSDGDVAASDDSGATWAEQTLPAGSWWSITFGNDTFLVVSSGAAGVATSDDNGETWVSRAFPTASFLNLSGFGNDAFVVAGTSGGAGSATYLVSLDNGATWTPRTLPVAGVWQEIASGGSVIAFVGSTDAMATSLPPNIYTDTLTELFVDAKARTGPFYMRVA